MKNLTWISIIFFIYFNCVIPINAQIISEGAFAQFLYTEFTDGIVTFKNDQYNSYKLNFNTITGKMVYLKDETIHDVVNPEIIDTIFVHQTRFTPIENTFFQVLLKAPISFYLQYKGELLSPENRSKYGVITQTPNVKIKTSFGSLEDRNLFHLVRIDLIYWVKIYGKMVSFTNKNGFLKLYPLWKAELELYIKQNKIKFDKPSDVKKLAEYFNRLALPEKTQQ